VFFYGAGCIPEKKGVVEKVLRKVFPDADRIEVESDLLGAARAVCQHQEGLACILGTGSNSCLYDGEKIMENIPPLGYILGDEGSGAVLGKLFLNALFKGALPDGMKEDFLQSSGLSYSEIIQRVYRQPMANRFLASTSLYISEHLDVPALRDLVKQNFRDFFHKNIAQYGRHDLPVGAIGSIAYHYRDLLQEVAEGKGYKLSTVAKSPMEGLVTYHLMK
jgi:N-acetylglucosamine kinase-like BadF-type ATPase